MELSIVNILGIKICAEPLPILLKKIRELLENVDKNSEYICATSVHGVIKSQDDINMKNILNNSLINYPDGKPLKVIGILQGVKQMYQIKGPDLFLNICEMTSSMNVHHYFYGGKEGVANDLAEKMQKKYQGLKVAGTFCPPFRSLNESEKNDIATAINASNADIVWVGLSTPKQEKWAADFQNRLKVKLIFTVGAAFDFHTGNIRFAPHFICALGLEWLYRLCSEPGRLWSRYSKIVPKFIFLSLLQLTRIKKY